MASFYTTPLVKVIMAFILSASFSGCERPGNENSFAEELASAKPPPPPPGPSDVAFWLTKGDKSALMQKQDLSLVFGTVSNRYPFIDVNDAQSFQTIYGFGYTLTGGSAYVINRLASAQKESLLRELFSSDSNAIRISYLRLSIGASDLNATVYTYDDMPAGQTDVNLQYFSLDPDRADVIPLLKQILTINPSIKIVATPWTAPVWMKTNGNSTGGSLKTEYYDAYGRYFLKYLQGMQAEGINIDAVTPQNEPLNPNNNPSMLMSETEQASFIKNYLGPTLRGANLNTKIILYDHNCDRPDYPITILNDAGANQYTDGSAFHLYAGDINALSQVHNAYPDKNVYFTEQYTASNGNFGGDLKWHIKNLVIGATRNWSRNVLEWNLANDPSFGPHTNGGCTTCLGAFTIGSTITRNVAYYIIAHASKFVPPGSIRIASNITGNLHNTAFKTPAGQKVLVVLNDGNAAQKFNIRFNSKWVTPTLSAGTVGTFIW